MKDHDDHTVNDDKEDDCHDNYHRSYQCCLTPHLKCIEERGDDDNHDDDDEGDDCDDNHHEDDKDDDCHDNYHRSILGVANAVDDCPDNYPRSILCVTSATKSEISVIIRIITTRMTTVMISIVAASSALPMLPNATFETYRK